MNSALLASLGVGISAISTSSTVLRTEALSVNSAGSLQKGRITCEEIAQQFHATAGKHDHASMCDAMKKNGADPACCKHNNCCKGPLCDLDEIYVAVDMKCPSAAALSQTASKTSAKLRGLSCDAIKEKYNEAGHDVNTVCTDISENGGDADCCTTLSCCAEKDACTYDDVTRALSLDCPASLAEVKRGPFGTSDSDKMSCNSIKQQFEGDGHDGAAVCTQVTADGASAACCNNPDTCCTGSDGKCSLNDVYTMVGMTAECTSGSGAFAGSGGNGMSCSSIAAQYRGATHDEMTMCNDMHADGATATCCEASPPTCCADDKACKLTEIYKSVGKDDCMGSGTAGTASSGGTFAGGAHGTMSCEAISKQYSGDSHSVTTVCEDINKDGASASCCVAAATDGTTQPNCCADATACTLNEVYEAVGMTSKCTGGSGTFSGALSCDAISSQYNGDAHDLQQVCNDMHKDGANPACCAPDVMNCCADAAACTLSEIYGAVGRSDCSTGSSSSSASSSGASSSSSGSSSGTSSDASGSGEGAGEDASSSPDFKVASSQGSLLEAGRKQKGKSCSEVGSIYKTVQKDSATLCKTMQANGGNPACCAKGDCFDNKEAGTLVEVITALGMNCHSSLIQQTQHGLTCEQVKGRFHAIKKTQDAVCLEMMRNGAKPSCCDTTCCRDKAACEEIEVYAALNMECPM